MTSQEEWRKIAYERWVGETGNNSMGTISNSGGYQNYLAREAASEQFYTDLSRSVQSSTWNHSPTAIPFTPTPPKLADLGGPAPPLRVVPPSTSSKAAGGSGFFDRPFFSILKVSDAEDFWNVSGWLFDPIERVTPRWLAISICSLVGLAAVILKGQGEVVVSLLVGAAGFVVPIVGYMALRLAVSTATFAVVLTVVLAIYGAVIAAAGAGVYVIYLLARLPFA